MSFTAISGFIPGRCLFRIPVEQGGIRTGIQSTPGRWLVKRSMRPVYVKELALLAKVAKVGGLVTDSPKEP